MPSRRHDGQRPPWHRYVGLGTELAGAVVGFTLLGLWIDRTWDTRPWGVIICLALGLVGGLYNFIRLSLQAVAKDHETSARDGSRK